MPKIIRKIIKNTLLILDQIMPLIILASVLNLSFPHLALAQNIDPLSVPQLPLETGKNEFLKAYISPIPRLPLEITGQKRESRFALKIWVTAYNSRPAQTDSTPCLTASGLNVCERASLGVEDIVATNFRYLPFGTKIELPELYPGKIFIVEDRMHRRFQRTVDVWLPDYQTAKAFGKKWTTVKIY